MNDIEKHDYILSGEQLLVVSSRFQLLTPDRKNLILSAWYLGGITVFAVGLVLAYIIKRIEMKIIELALHLAGTVGIILLGRYSVDDLGKQHFPLVVTDRGITFDPDHCATWDEIKSWSLCSYYGLNRAVGLGVNGEGTTIKVDTGDLM